MKTPASKIIASYLKLTLPVLFLLLNCFAQVGSVSAQGKTEGLEIKSMQVKLFMMREGTFGEDLVATDQARIVWNIGVNAISETFLVIVEVTGPAEYRESLPTLVLTAETIRGIFQRQTARIQTAVDGKYYAAFLVPMTGCVPIKLVARIARQRKPSIKSQLINFQCGE